MDDLIKQIKARMNRFGRGHDFTHIERVVENARRINQVEQEPNHLVEILAWTHDYFDDKFVKDVSIENDFPKLVKNLNLNETEIEMLVNDLKNFGFKGGFNKRQLSKVGQIVSDADRLDAIGAIGIARAMMYGRVLYTDEKYKSPETLKEYRDPNRPILFHFYDKLLKIKDTLFTETGKQIAQERHNYMVEYLNQLQKEIGKEIL